MKIKKYIICYQPKTLVELDYALIGIDGGSIEVSLM